MANTTQESISNILKCNDKPLLEKIEHSLHIFNNLSLESKYNISFSGGKDSHALLSIFLIWKLLNKVNTDKFTVKFADTLLEVTSIHILVDNIIKTLPSINIVKVKPKHSYWYYQFGIGYPVPDYRIRWCTSELKIESIKAKGELSITGRHLGESNSRDKKLTCGSNECGIDKIKKTIDPLFNFRNCDIWDLLYYSDGTILYEGVFNLLKETYKESTDEKGSLRMGCFMCPVINKNKLVGERENALGIRNSLEKLRTSRRLLSPRSKKNGAIYIKDRIKVWEELDKQLLLELGYLTEDEKKEIDFLLSVGTYPKTYSKEWINLEHKRIEN